MNIDWLPLERDTVAEGAVMYAEHGWPVFPCRGKQPYTSDGFKGASSSPIEVARMWRQWPDANVAWPVREGWFALDVDPRHDGDKSLRQLERKHGALPMTLRAITGSGGEHWIFRVPTGVELRQLAGFCPGLDTRLGGRGYLLVAPSVHPDTGKRYRWLATVEPVEPPAWLVDLVKAPAPPPPRAPYVPPTSSQAADREARYAQAALKGCVEEVKNAGKGQRNNALNKAWFRMAQLRHSISRGEVEAALLDAALTVGLSEREARQVMR